LSTCTNTGDDCRCIADPTPTPTVTPTSTVTPTFTPTATLPANPVPTTSSGGLVLALLALAAVGIVGLTMRRAPGPAH
jgi:hypothetical protein